MDVTPLIRAGSKVIQSYSGGKFKVSGAVYEAAIIVTAEEVITWTPANPENLNPEDFAALAGRHSELDVVLLGTGKTMRILMPDLRRALKEQGLVVEAMDTGAACRTYNVLMAEGRRVAAALLPA